MKEKTQLLFYLNKYLFTELSIHLRKVVKVIFLCGSANWFSIIHTFKTLVCCKTRLKKYDGIAELSKEDRAGMRTAAYLGSCEGGRDSAG